MINTIQVKYSRENLISRTFGLFPYCEFDNGIETIHVATDSNTGCYGKIVPNIILPVDFYVNDEQILTSGHVYTYRYLMDLYVQYSTEYHDSDFIKFFERGIGKHYIDAESIGLGDKEKYPLVPEYIYLSKTRTLLDYMFDLKKHSELLGEIKYTDCGLCKDRNKFIAYGGETFIAYLESLLVETDIIAEEYFGYASNDELKVMFDVPLLQTNFDLGMSTCYINKWVPGEKYYCGDIVTYNGITYVCVLNQIVQTPCDEHYFIEPDIVEDDYYNNSGTQCQYVICNGVFYVLDGTSNQYVETELCIVECIELYVACVTELCEYIYSNGTYYHLNDENVYEEISVCEYTTGVFNEETHAIDFDYAHFIPMTDFVQLYGANETQNQDEVEGWYYSDNQYGTKYKIFIDINYMPDSYVYDYIRFLGDFYVWDGEHYVIDNDNCGIYKLKGTSDSSLRQFMAKDSFFDQGNEVIVPEFGNDFLYFYKIGKTTNLQVSYEENGNITRFTQANLNVGSVATDLIAYGDVLNDIVVNPETREIKFYYSIGAHLKAVCTDIVINELLELLYFFEGNFLYDEDDTHGIKHVETYSYDEGGDLDILISDGNFEYYISNYNSDIIIKDSVTDLYINQGTDMDYVTQVPTSYTTEYIITPGTTTILGDIYKWDGNSYVLYSNNVRIFNYTGLPMLFHTTDDNVNTVNVSYGCENVDYTFIKSEYSEDVVNELDVLYNPTYKEDYLNGIAYANIINTGISVGRGNAASIERHVKLGGVKTFNDLNEYANQGFFNVTQTY